MAPRSGLVVLPRLPVGLRRAVTDLGCLPCTPRATLRSRFRSPAVNGSLPAEGFAFSGESRVKTAPSIVPSAVRRPCVREGCGAPRGDDACRTSASSRRGVSFWRPASMVTSQQYMVHKNVNQGYVLMADRREQRHVGSSPRVSPRSRGSASTNSCSR